MRQGKSFVAIAREIRSFSRHTVHPLARGAFVLGKTERITAKAGGSFANKNATKMTGKLVELAELAAR